MKYKIKNETTFLVQLIVKEWEAERENWNLDL